MSKIWFIKGFIKKNIFKQKNNNTKTSEWVILSEPEMYVCVITGEANKIKIIIKIFLILILKIELLLLISINYSLLIILHLER